MHKIQAAIADRDYVDSAGYGSTGWPEAPCQGGSIRPDVRRTILFEHEACQEAIQKPLRLVAERLPPDEFSIWIDEPHVFCISSLDRSPSAFGISLGEDLVQVAVKQLLYI